MFRLDELLEEKVERFTRTSYDPKNDEKESSKAELIGKNRYQRYTNTIDTKDKQILPDESSRRKSPLVNKPHRAFPLFYRFERDESEYSE